MKSSLLFLMLCLMFLAFAGQAQEELKNSPWHIYADDIDPNDYYGVTVGNGMIGIISAPQPNKISEVVLNGVYDTYGRGRVSNIMKTFEFMNLEVIIDGLDLLSYDYEDFSQTVDMKHGQLITNISIPGKAKVKTRMLAVRHLPFNAMTIVEIEAKDDIEVKPYSIIESPDMLRDVHAYYNVIERPHVRIPIMTSVANSPTGKHKVAASTTFLFDEAHHDQPEVIHEEWDYTRHWTHFKKILKKGETYRFAVLGAACSTEQIPDPHNEAERLTIFGKLEGIDRIERFHNAAWDKLWESDIIIEGDLESQRAVRSMIYHLYSFTRAGQAYSLSPMGLSGLGYNGHVFWDTEIWMYPSLLLLNPDMARSLLEYRFERMEMARINAFSHGYKGVMFPWESADTGQECTPVWALTGPFQHHITGDIGWAFWKYYQLTRDREFLETRAYPMLKEVAAFWCSRVERNGPGKYDIKNVIGANEYEENIDNNAYTNGMAITVLGYATEAAKALGLEPDPDWAHVAKNIPILTFEDGVTRENATYNGAVIKQADVNLLAYPMNIISGKENIKKDLAYYEGRMDPKGPAMGWSVLAVLYARMQDPETAFNWFQQSYLPNEVPPFEVMSETAGGTNPYFATGAGGALQVLLNGFGGLDLDEHGLKQLDTKLPKAWKSLTLKGIGPDQKTFTVK